MNFYQFLDKLDTLVETDTHQVWESVVIGALLITLLIRILVDKLNKRRNNGKVS